MLYRIVENGYPGEENRCYFTVEFSEDRLLWWRFWKPVKDLGEFGWSGGPKRFASIEDAKAWIQQDKSNMEKARKAASVPSRRIVYQEVE